MNGNDSHGHELQHTDVDDHDHDHEGSALSEMDLRVRALESLLVEKGYVDPGALDVLIENCTIQGRGRDPYPSVEPVDAYAIATLLPGQTRSRNRCARSTRFS